jgi:NTP pyrophosphatase (non-canonical NTP hydrolase)
LMIPEGLRKGGSVDRWERIFRLQADQQKSFGLSPQELSPVERSEAANHLCLGLYEEAAELARIAVRFKRHLLRAPAIDRSEIAEEGADVVKYVVAIAQLHGIDAEELFSAFLRKTDVVKDKAEGERIELTRDTKIILVDLDGCVADLGPLEARLKGLTIVEQEGIKKDFRRGGGFRDLPMVEGAQDGLAELRRMGYQIAFITARPYRHHKRLYADTVEWLKKNRIEYELLLFRRDKAEALVDHIFPARPVCFVEDREKHALEIIDTGTHVLLLDVGARNQNPSIVDGPLITRVWRWEGIINWVKDRTQNE